MSQSAMFLLGSPMGFSPMPCNTFAMMNLSSMLMSQMLMSFMQDGFQSQSACPCCQNSNLFAPQMDLPWGPSSQQFPSQGAPQEQYRPSFRTPSNRQDNSNFATTPLTQPVRFQAPATVHPQTRTAKYDPTKDAASLNEAMKGGMFGLGTDEKAIMATLNGKSSEQIAVLKANYKDHYGKNLGSQLKGELSKSDFTQARSLMNGHTANAAAEKAPTAASKSKLSDVQTLRNAMEGFGTDEAAIKSTLAGKSKEEIGKLRADYKKQTGQNLDAQLKSELGGRDEFEAMQALKGRSESIEEALQRANEHHTFERNGASNVVGGAVMDMVNGKGALLDKNNARANEQYEAYSLAKSEGRFGDAEREKQRLEQLIGYSNADVGSYQTSKDAVADTAGTVAATAAAVAVVVGTAGTATPLVATALYAGGAGAAARTLTTSSISGAAYDSQNLASDAGVGAIEGATVVLGAGAGRAAAATVKGAGTGARVAAATLEGAVDGLVGGGVGGAGSQALRDGTWDDGLTAGLSQVGVAAGTGAVAGMVAGGGTAFAIKVAPSVAQAGRQAAHKVADFGQDAARTVDDFGRRAGQGMDDFGRRASGAFDDFSSRSRTAWDDASSKGRKAWDDTTSRGRNAWNEGRKAWDEGNQAGRTAGQQTGRAADNFSGTGRAAQRPPTDLEVLGLDINATLAEVKKAHRKLAMKHHPDMGGDAASFRAIQEAYENLATRMK